MTHRTHSAWIHAVLLTGAAIALTAMLPSTPAWAQESESKTAALRQEPEQTQTIFLKNATWSNDLNEVGTNLRNMLPHARVYCIPSQNSITIRATAEDLQAAQKLIAELDQPKKVYRVTFTINESDNGRKTGTRHVALTVIGDSKSWMKQGSRVPIVTGSYDKDASTANTQIQYLDVGINIETAISGTGMRAKFEESSVAEEKSNVGIQDPIVRQTALEAQSTFVPGKPISLGAIDIPGTTRHQDIEAVAELVP